MFHPLHLLAMAKLFLCISKKSSRFDIRMVLDFAKIIAKVILKRVRKCL